MKKIVLTICLIGIILVSSLVAAGMLIPANENVKENAQAPENSPVIDETAAGEWELDRVDFIHYVKPDGSIGAASAKPTSCYKLMGVKWATLPVNYVINPTNSGLDPTFVTSTIQTSAETWDLATSQELFNDAYTTNSSAQYGVQNYQNAIAFGNYPTANVIAVTSVWYTRVGKRIVEFDMMFDTDFAWGDATIDSTKMDLQNIAVHELGHSVGLADLYSTACSEVTMYGYSAYGEIDKRSLENPDITGLQKMYGI